MAWFKTGSAFSGNAMIVNKGGIGSDAVGQNLNYGIWMDSNERINGGFEVAGGANVFIKTSGPLNDNKWHHVVLTYDGSILRLFIDNVLSASASSAKGPDKASTAPFRIGANSRANDSFFKGQIDEVKLWSRALSIQEISDHYGFAGINSSTIGQLLYMNGVSHTRIPIANAGAGLTANEMELVTLDGTTSYDPDADPLRFAWIQRESGGPWVSLLNSNSSAPSFIAPAVSALGTIIVFELRVDDGRGGVSSDIVNVSIQDVFQEFAANAGPDQSVTENEIVTLDGRASYNPNGDPLSYQWTQVGGPSVSLSSSNSSIVNFTAPLIDTKETLHFNLSVSDGLNERSDEVSVFVYDASNIMYTVCAIGCDYDNLQSAVDASTASPPGRRTTVFIADGEYIIQSPVSLNSNITLIFSENADIAYTGLGGSNVGVLKGINVKNIEIVDPQIRSKFGGVRGISLISSANINVTGGEITMVRGSNSAGFHCRDCSNVFVSKISISLASRLIDIDTSSEVYDGKSSNIWVLNGTFKTSSIEGIRINHSFDVHIIGNSISDTANNGIDIGSNRQSEVRNNKIDNGGIPDGSGIHTDSANGAVISNNTITKTGNVGIVVHRASNIKVLNNIVFDAGIQAIAVITASEISSNITVSFNRLVHPLDDAIYVSANQNQVIVSYNEISQLVPGRLAINVQKPNVSTVVEGNIVI
jgi:parallel beta-helix repeat protein